MNIPECNNLLCPNAGIWRGTIGISSQQCTECIIGIGDPTLNLIHVDSTVVLGLYCNLKIGQNV